MGRVSGIMAKEGRRHPKRNLREISPGGAGVFYRGSLLAGHAQMLTPVKGLLRHPNCCLGKLVEKTLKQIKYAATNHNHKINATGQNIRCLTGGPEQMNISGVTSMIKHSWQFLLVSLCFRPYDCKVIVSVYNGCCNKTGTHKHTNNYQHSHKTKPNKTKALH